jgi:hypothetical protein
MDFSKVRPIKLTPPADAERRRAAFARRNDAAGLEELAHRLFRSLDEKARGLDKPFALYREKRFAASLEAFRDYFFDKLAHLEKYGITPDELRDSLSNNALFWLRHLKPDGCRHRDSYRFAGDAYAGRRISAFAPASLDAQTPWITEQPEPGEACGVVLGARFGAMAGPSGSPPTVPSSGSARNSRSRARFTH